MNDVDIAFFCAHVKPFTSNRKMDACYAKHIKQNEKKNRSISNIDSNWIYAISIPFSLEL